MKFKSFWKFSEVLMKINEYDNENEDKEDQDR